jgi:hypothetical protein
VAELFPLGLSNGPPNAAGLAEVAGAGINFVRTGIADWNLNEVGAQLTAEKARLDAARAHGLRCWLWLGDVANLPTTAGSANEQLLVRIADSFVGHPALGAYKGIDEPRNPFRGQNWVRPAGLVRAYKRLKQVDPVHPLVIVQAPRGPAAQLVPYRPAFDITGVDVYPVSYPPGVHTDSRNKEVSVVGDMTAKMVQAAGGKPVWTTLQIAWSGTLPPHVARFPTLLQERFMAYHAIVSGARGLFFFGGHLTRVAAPADVRAGWNWTFWREVLQPVVAELDSLQPLLVAPDDRAPVKAVRAPDVRTLTRRVGGHLFVIAVRRGSTTSQVQFAGLPKVGAGEVLFEYVDGLPRKLAVANNGFEDWLGPHDVRVYRFGLT